ncbi:hypothetical protein MMSP_0790 [Mycobacterium sp. 012931]|nr:hypothetical protein MMSP_0790 [Mycobacterium sp. 012931]MBC9860864.1 hypothetical protein [Mycobacterium pseudoshottsii]
MGRRRTLFGGPWSVTFVESSNWVQVLSAAMHFARARPGLSIGGCWWRGLSTATADLDRQTLC